MKMTFDERNLLKFMNELATQDVAKKIMAIQPHKLVLPIPTASGLERLVEEQIGTSNSGEEISDM